MAKTPSVLLVDPDSRVLSRLEDVLQGVAITTSCRAFAPARDAMDDPSIDLLVTNIRLEAFNGLHLVLRARERSRGLRCVVYDRTHDMMLARVAQDAGAFYERYERLPATLVAYALLVDLPPMDRRDPSRVDRRHVARGGRRAADVVAAV